MEENRNQTGTDQNQDNQRQTQTGSTGQTGQQQGTSGQQQDQNPQDGAKWSNYQTRELAGNSTDSDQENTSDNA